MKERVADIPNTYLIFIRISFFAIAIFGYFFLSFALTIAMMDVTASLYSTILILGIIALFFSAFLIVGIFAKKKMKIVGISAIILAVLLGAVGISYLISGIKFFPIATIFLSLILLGVLLSPKVLRYYFK